MSEVPLQRIFGREWMPTFLGGNGFPRSCSLENCSRSVRHQEFAWSSERRAGVDDDCTTGAPRSYEMTPPRTLQKDSPYGGPRGRCCFL